MNTQTKVVDYFSGCSKIHADFIKFKKFQSGFPILPTINFIVNCEINCNFTFSRQMTPNKGKDAILEYNEGHRIKNGMKNVSWHNIKYVF